MRNKRRIFGVGDKERKRRRELTLHLLFTRDRRVSRLKLRTGTDNDALESVTTDYLERPYYFYRV